MQKVRQTYYGILNKNSQVGPTPVSLTVTDSDKCHLVMLGQSGTHGASTYRPYSLTLEKVDKTTIKVSATHYQGVATTGYISYGVIEFY